MPFSRSPFVQTLRRIQPDIMMYLRLIAKQAHLRSMDQWNCGQDQPCKPGLGRPGYAKPGQAGPGQAWQVLARPRLTWRGFARLPGMGNEGIV